MESQSSQEQSGRRDYEVFLSFRGPDTRQGFTDCLYHFLTDKGIRVFRDDEEQRLGDPITKIMDAVGNSIICIIIFSTNFASSKWCMRELAKMVELDKVIIPIFYDVTPNDVKLKDGSPYLDALRTAAASVQPSEEVVKWVEALKKVGGLSGRELKDTGFGEFSMSIVKEVLEMLNVKDKIVTKKLVGMDDRVKAVLQLLHMESHDEVRCVGIHGIGGIGKTTLAKVVFNELKAQFDPDDIVFLSDVRETSKLGLKHLQEQFLFNLLRTKTPTYISDTDRGTQMIGDLLCGKKVFMVLDDVDHVDQIDKLIPRDCRRLDPRSKIIFTTRDRCILTNLRERSVKLEDFEMKEMEDSEALQLFNKHAFKEACPLAEYLDLAKEVISVVGRLPLAIEVIASYLCSRHQTEWRDKMRILEKIPQKDVQKKLMISYESLEFRAKQIFLDIACFFGGKDITYAIYMWEACNLHPELGLEELTSKSLIKITDEDEFWMHDRLKDLGREIVCLEGVTDLGKRSRLLLPEEASGMFRRREGTRKVEALRLPDDDDALPFSSEEFKILKNLRFLECPRSTFAGDFRHVLSKLKWLSWKFCPSDFKANNLNLESLVILELSGTDIDENWKGWTCMKIGNTLKVLDLTGCSSLRRIPSLSSFKKLERLVLNYCDNLGEIDNLGELKNLKSFIMNDCFSLQGFPNELCSLYSMEEIVLERLYSLSYCPFTLPESIGNLRSLKVLGLVGLQIDQVPESIGELVMLRRLSFSNCLKLRKLPGSLGKLKSLNVLDIERTRVGELPDSIAELEGLEVLNIANTLIEKLPSLGNLSRLRMLNLDGCRKLSELPQLPSSLTTLQGVPMSLKPLTV